MQLLHNRYFEVLADHKVIEYMIKSKTESPTMRLKTLLLKLSEYTIDLKHQKGSEMHTSNALSRLHNFTDTPDQKDVIPLNFLQHFTPHYIEHSYSHLVENLYAHNVVLLPCGSLSLNPFIEISIRNNSSSSDVLNIQASISISPKFESK